MLVACILLAAACSGPRRDRQLPVRKTPPVLVLWAWDRYEDLRFLRPGEAEVAGLLATIQLRHGRASVRHRSLPLYVPDGIPLRAVVRMESDATGLPPADGVAHWFELVASRGRTAGLQVDFDARQSERVWYLQVLREARTWFPDISITALTSWCVGGSTLVRRKLWRRGSGGCPDAVPHGPATHGGTAEASGPARIPGSVPRRSRRSAG